MNTFLKDCRWGKFLLLRNDMISVYADYYGEWSEGEIDLFRKILPEDADVIEVGSNIGMHAVPLSKICAKGKIVCFEPQRIIFQLLCANAAINDRTNVFARNCAVGDEPGTVAIPSCSYDTLWNYGSFSVTAGFSTEDAFTGETTPEQTDIVTLDADPAVAALERVRLIKIDAEGFEVNVLRGARGIIDRFQPYIFLEANSERLLNQTLPQLHSLGYKAYWYCSIRNRKNNFNNADPATLTGHDVNIISAPAASGALDWLVPATAFAELAKGQRAY